ncbi:MAG: hypothetical protein DRJ64_04055, partial [Thermoprotei archaeon]
VASVDKYLAIRDGKLKAKIQKGRSKFQPKLVRKQNEWRYASLTEALLASEDMYDVEPSTHADTTSARDNAIIINKQFEVDIDRVGFIDKYVRTAVDEGTVIVRTGWEFEEEIIEVTKPVMIQVMNPQMQQQLQQAQQAVQMGQMDPMQFQMMQQQAQQQLQTVESGQYETVEELSTIYNRPTIEVCDYDKVLLDPTCGGDLDKAGMIAYQFQTSKAELNEDPKYKNVAAILYDSEETLSESDAEKESFNYGDEARKKIDAIEYWGDWDIHGDGSLVAIVATYVGNTMIRLEENPFPDQKAPFTKVVYLPKRGNVYGGEPDAVLIEEHQDIIGAVTRGMIDLMGKSANSQQGISANALDPAQKIRFEQGKDYLFNPDVDPTKAFFMSTYPEIPQSAMQMIQFQEQGAEALTSIRAFSASQGGNSMGATATAVKTASDATNKREMAILRRLSSGLIEIGRKILAMNAVNLEDEEVVRITDEEEVTISRETLDGKYDLRLSVSTPEVDMEQAQDLGFMLQTIGPNMDPGLQGVILGKIARLKKMPELAKRIEEYKPEPDPMEEEIKQLQRDLLEAQVNNERAKGTENQADTELKYAKAESEKAKARALESTADMTDLDFVQKKDGTQELRGEAGKMRDHKRAGEMENQKAVNSIDDQRVSAALDKENPIYGSSSPTPPKEGSSGKPRGSGVKKPVVFNANNHYQKSLDNVLPGMDTPSENLKDGLVLKGSGRPIS